MITLNAFVGTAPSNPNPNSNSSPSPSPNAGTTCTLQPRNPASLQPCPATLHPYVPRWAPC